MIKTPTPTSMGAARARPLGASTQARATPIKAPGNTARLALTRAAPAVRSPLRRPAASAPPAPARAARAAPRARAARGPSYPADDGAPSAAPGLPARPDKKDSAPAPGAAGGAAGLTDAALADLAARLAPLLAAGVASPGAAAGRGSDDSVNTNAGIEAALEGALDDWAAAHLAPGAAKPGALLRELMQAAAAPAAAGSDSPGAGAGAGAAPLAATAAAAAAAAPVTPKGAAPKAGRRASWEGGVSGSPPALPPDFDAAPDSDTIHDGFWERWARRNAAAAGAAAAPTDSTETLAGSPPPSPGRAGDVAAAADPWASAWARRAGWDGPACARVCAPVAAIAAALLRAESDVDAEPGLAPRPVDVFGASPPRGAAGAALAAELSAARALPPRAAASQLMRLHAAGVLRRAVALVAGSGDSRDEVEWLGAVLRAVAPRLGLIECGLVLATVWARFGRDDMLASTAAALLPSPAARLRCLLAHWALLPQLASAALPALPVAALADLCIAAAADGAAAGAAGMGDDDEEAVLVSTVAEQGATPEPSLASALWMRLERIDPSAFAAILLAIDAAAAPAPAPAAARGGRPASAAPAAAALGAAFSAVASGLRPMAPSALLLAAGIASAAPGARAARLLQHLLRACAAVGEDTSHEPHATSLGDGVAHALWQVSRAAGVTNEISGRYVEAAASVLLGLPLADLPRVASDMMAACAYAGAAGAAAGALAERALILAAERGDDAQAFAILSAPGVLESTWEAVWAVVVSPVRGTFCASARGLSGALAAIPATDARRLRAAWGALLAHRGWAEVAAEVAGADQIADRGSDCGGVAVEEVLSAVLQRAPLAGGAAHVAALASLIEPSELSRLAAAGFESLEKTAYGAPTSAGAVAWLSAARALAEEHAAFAPAPRALRALCVAASALPGGELPAFLRAAAAAADAERRRRDRGPALRLLYACMASGRAGGDGFQSLMINLAEDIPPDHARALLAACGPAMAPAARAAAAAAAEAGEALEEESIWQLGRRPAAAADDDTPAPAAPAAPRKTYAQAAAAPPVEESSEAVRELSRLVADVPHAPPAGGSEDAMQDPERVARLLRRVMALLSAPAWAPGRAEAGAAAGLLGALAAKRGWADGDLAGLLCRLPAPAALRLLMVAGSASPDLAGRRPALLAALARWHGAAEVAERLRVIYEEERSFPLGDVTALLADARPALDGAAAAAGGGGGFAAAVAAVLGGLRGVAPAGAARHRHGYGAALAAGAEGAIIEDTAAAAAARTVVAPPAVTAGDLADLICVVHSLAPPAPARALLRELGASLGAPARAAVAASLPAAAQRTLGKGPALAAELSVLLGAGVESARVAAHGDRAEGKLRAAAGGGGGGAHADAAATSLRAAAASGRAGPAAGAADISEREQRERARDALRAAAATGGRGAHADRAAAALRGAADAPAAARCGGGAREGGGAAAQQLHEIADLLRAAPATDPLPFLRRAMRGGGARLLLRALPFEAASLPAAVTAPVLALAAAEFAADPAEWEAALFGCSAAADASAPAAGAPVLSPRTRRAYAQRPDAPRGALLLRLVRALQRLGRPNRDDLVTSYAAVLRASAGGAVAARADFEPAAELLAEMVSPAPPAPASQGLGASGAARLAGLLLTGPGETLRAADVLVPSLARAYVDQGGDAAAWFSRAIANELPRLPLDRAALGLVLLQPSLARARGLRAAASAVAAAYGADAAASALESVWFSRHGGATFAPGGDAPFEELVAALRPPRADAPPAGAAAADAAAPGTAVVPAGGADKEVAAGDDVNEGNRVGAAALGVTLGVASLAVAARLAGRVFGVGQPAGRMLFGSWWVLGATVSAAALLSEWMLSADDSDGGSGSGSDGDGADKGGGASA